MYRWSPMLATFTYGTCCGIERTPVDADVAVFAGSRYWIVVKVKPGTTSVFVWNLNDTGDLGNVSLSMDSGTSWTPFASASLAAFDVLGH